MSYVNHDSPKQLNKKEIQNLFFLFVLWPGNHQNDPYPASAKNHQEKGVGQVELANAIHVSKGIVSLWENGLREPCLTSLVALSKYFQVSIDDLVGLD